MNERSILILSNGKRAQRIERRIAGAEIVDRDRHPQRLDLAQDMQRRTLSAMIVDFGQLQLQPFRRQPGLEQDLGDASLVRSAWANWTGDRLTATLVAAAATRRLAAGASAAPIRRSP
jgi:hypothetical protein